MPRVVRAAAAQLAPDLETGEGTLRKVLDWMDEAAGRGVELMVFPETFLPYYPYFSFVYPPLDAQWWIGPFGEWLHTLQGLLMRIVDTSCESSRDVCVFCVD